MTSCWDSCPSICGERSMTIEVAAGTGHQLRYVLELTSSTPFRGGLATFQRDS